MDAPVDAGEHRAAMCTQRLKGLEPRPSAGESRTAVISSPRRSPSPAELIEYFAEWRCHTPPLFPLASAIDTTVVRRGTVRAVRDSRCVFHGVTQAIDFFPQFVGGAAGHRT